MTQDKELCNKDNGSHRQSYSDVVVMSLSRPSVDSKHYSNDSVIDKIKEKLKHLLFKERPLLKNVLLKYKDLFYDGISPLGCTSHVKHRIDTGNASPVKKTPYLTPVTQREIVKPRRHP